LLPQRRDNLRSAPFERSNKFCLHQRCVTLVSLPDPGNTESHSSRFFQANRLMSPQAPSGATCL
jgi:hypothetical protein